MSGSGEPITRCPVCLYDLTGLPSNHRCPECGFEYDETTRVWWMRVVPPRLFWCVIIICDAEVLGFALAADFLQLYRATSAML